MRTSYGRGRITTIPTEYDLIYDRAYTPGRSPVTVIFCHGSGENATTTMTKPESHSQMRAFAKNNRVLVGDFGGQTWGNDVVIKRVKEAVDYAGGDPVVLVGASMGGCNALAFTRAYPEKVLGVALLIPLLDITTILDMGYESQVDAAYGGNYDDAVHGPYHNPVRYATELPASLPIKMWTASNDPLALPSTADEFVSLRPQTERQDLGPVGHTGLAIIASTPSMTSWIRSVV